MTLNVKFTGVAVAALFALGACTDPAYGPGGERQRTAQGAAIGAGIGAALGGTIKSGDDRVENAIIGAAIGGLVGGAIGNSLDKQAQELNQSLSSDVGVINTGDSLIVRMPQDILFAVDSAQVRPDLRADLFTLADSLNRYPDTTVTIVGHTDNTGSAAYNQDLSERRANAVRAVLINAGVAPARIRALGAGEAQPIATNQTAEGRALNRRVDITIRPN
ncbi:OmpA family protein [Ovoidimarina sediminis]|uniref:OmpA family protein n=1 Tax=Ovoidimarina sediminis TaxID=3079856 RepID=UPI00290A92D2|nr:OmpA family protein [Rhodophyticola sp. MJ-SS7]MDU8944778.1 OmpA family protein [Rhodophyticola sp. MJ-SS7]